MMTHLRTKLVTLASFLAVFAVLAVNIQALKAYVTEEFDVSDDVRVDVRTSGGFIEVYGKNTDEVKVEMIVRKRGRLMDRGDVDLDDWDIDISRTGNTVTASAKRRGRSWGNNNVSISFKVYTPIRAITDLNTSGGSITLENLMGDQKARTSGGSLSAASIDGDLDLKTSGGSITIEDVQGFADVNTSGGRIRAENVTGGIKARTSGGSITLEEVNGNVEASTSGGSINAEIPEPDDFIELKTSGGSITITVPKDQGYEVDLDGNRVRADLKNFSGKYEKDEIKGTLNGGGTRIFARTSGGSVTLRYL